MMPNASRPKNEFSLIYRNGKGYAVAAPNGAIVLTCTGRQQAETARADLQRAADLARGKRERPCMCCQRSFMSEGFHNRLCQQCRLNGEQFAGMRS